MCNPVGGRNKTTRVVDPYDDLGKRVTAEWVHVIQLDANNSTHPTWGPVATCHAHQANNWCPCRLAKCPIQIGINHDWTA